MERRRLQACSLCISTALATGIIVHAAVAGGCGGSTSAPPASPSASTAASSYAPPPHYFYPTKAPTPVFYPPQQGQSR